jgi:hypothetical protein
MDDKLTLFGIWVSISSTVRGKYFFKARLSVYFLNTVLACTVNNIIKIINILCKVPVD